MAGDGNNNDAEDAKGRGMVRKRVGARLGGNERVEEGERELKAERVGC